MGNVLELHMDQLTQYELYDVHIGLRGEALSTSGMLLTVVSGYLAIAYFVGRSLTRVQVTIVTGIFLVFTLAQIGGHFSTMMELGSISSQIITLKESSFSADMWAAVFLIINISIAAASLKFMWDVRGK